MIRNAARLAGGAGASSGSTALTTVRRGLARAALALVHADLGVENHVEVVALVADPLDGIVHAARARDRLVDRLAELLQHFAEVIREFHVRGDYRSAARRIKDVCRGRKVLSSLRPSAPREHPPPPPPRASSHDHPLAIADANADGPEESSDFRRPANTDGIGTLKADVFRTSWVFRAATRFTQMSRPSSRMESREAPGAASTASNRPRCASRRLCFCCGASTARVTSRRAAPAPSPTFRAPRPSRTGSSDSRPRTSPAAATSESTVPATTTREARWPCFIVRTFNLQ